MPRTRPSTRSPSSRSRTACSGTKGLTHVKVGTVKAPEGRPIIRPGGYAPPKLTVDQEGVFFLQKHPSESFYVLQGAMSVINKANNDNYEKEAARVKECAKLLADPKAALKSKDADDARPDRQPCSSSATTPRTGQTKREAIDADESKQILTALAEADWTKGNDVNGLSPQWGFGRLGLTDKDGWNAAGPFTAPNSYQDAAKAWLKGHADTYRVQKLRQRQEGREK